MMADILDISGRKISKEKKEDPGKSETGKEKVYDAGGIALKTVHVPKDMLDKALHGARAYFANQAFGQAFKRSGDQLLARAEAEAEASKVTDPFTMEAAALAVFMALAREISRRDSLIEQINERLKSLGQDPIEVKPFS